MKVNKRYEGKIEVICRFACASLFFKTEVLEGELRIEVIDDEVLVSPV
jgi:hypothetical protein